jgi:hypothetical protein
MSDILLQWFETNGFKRVSARATNCEVSCIYANLDEEWTQEHDRQPDWPLACISERRIRLRRTRTASRKRY